MTLDAILAGIGAIVTAAGGIILVVRELRRRDRIASVRQIDNLSGELLVTRQDFLVYQQWAFHASQIMVANGIIPPPLPEIHLAAPPSDEPRPGMRDRWKRWRHGRRQERRQEQDQEQTQPVA